jgi:hypothetical protein
MATPRMDITSFVGKLLEEDDVDALCEGVRVLAQVVMETEAPPRSGPGPYERWLRSSRASCRRSRMRCAALPTTSARPIE